MRILAATVLALAISSFSFVSNAVEENEDQGMKALAIQNRHHIMTHEFGFWFGTLPLDAFTKGLTFTGAYTIHFNDIYAWEVGQFTYSYDVDTDLKDDLANLQQAVGTTPFETVQYFVTTSFLLKPLYGKLAVFNRFLVFGEMFIDIGAGYGWMDTTERPVVSVGAGVRIYVGRYVSFRLDLRDYMFINQDDLHNEIWIALGICLGF